MLNFILLIASALFGSFGQLFLKKGAITSNLSGNYLYYFIDLISNFYVWIGCSFYAISLTLYMIALNKTELSTARSISAASYIAVVILSTIFFHDKITILKIISVIFITTGIFLLSFDIK